MTDDVEKKEASGNKEESFAELFEAFGDDISHDVQQGDKIQGKVIAIGTNSVYVSTGSKSDGVVDKKELLDENGDLTITVGDTLELYVVSMTESEIILSKALSGAGTLDLLEEASFNKTPVEGKVTETIKGGFSVDIMGKRAFCPVSQIDIKYVETPEDYVGQQLAFIITRFSESGRNIVISRRDLLNREIKASREEFLKNLKQGDTCQGRVVKLMPYGAFIELSPGVEGMAHISELSWSRVDKAEEALSPDESVTVKILKIEARDTQDSPKISLSLKQMSPDPWERAMDTIHPGDQFTGKVVRLAPFGAFVEIEPGIDGLVHLSEMSHIRRIVKAEDAVSQGEHIQVVVKEINPDQKRISLSMKDAQDDPWAGVTTKYQPGQPVEGTVEKREQFGLFISLEPGITGLLPASLIGKSTTSADFDRLKPGDTVSLVVENTDEDARRISLAPPDLREKDNWKPFVPSEKKSLGTMGSLLMEAMEKSKK